MSKRCYHYIHVTMATHFSKNIVLIFNHFRGQMCYLIHIVYQMKIWTGPHNNNNNNNNKKKIHITLSYMMCMFRKHPDMDTQTHRQTHRQLSGYPQNWHRYGSSLNNRVSVKKENNNNKVHITLLYMMCKIQKHPHMDTQIHRHTHTDTNTKTHTQMCEHVITQAPECVMTSRQCVSVVMCMYNHVVMWKSEKKKKIFWGQKIT